MSLLLYVGAAVILVVVYWVFLKPSPPPTPTFAPKPVKFDAIKPRMGAGIGGGSGGSKAVKKAGQIGVKIFFGSQTGTAEDFSGTLADEASSYDFFPEVVDMEEYDEGDLENEEFAIFCLATYGEGEPTDNAKQMFDWIEDESNTTDLSNLKYTVFGLGNKTYEHYNAVARIFDKRLEELGAKRIYEKGEGDDDASLEEDFGNWKAKLWENACRAFGMSTQQKGAGISKKNYVLEEMPASTKTAPFVTWQKTVPNPSIIDQKSPKQCAVKVSRELHGPKSDRSCIHMEIALDSRMRFTPGDHLGIFAPNDMDEVCALVRVLGANPTQMISLHPEGNSRPVLGPCSIEHAFKTYSDITTPPSKQVLKTLAELYTTDEAEKTRLQLLGNSSEAGWAAYNEYVKTPQRTIREILEDFPSCKPDVGHLLELLKDMAPRYYSISSSFNAHPGMVHITAVVTDYVTGTGRRHRGICTTFLASLEAGNATIPCFVRTSTFRLPRSPKTPLLLIGPGTGIAPFRGFLQERRFLIENGKEVGECMLLFGCRARDVDFLYEEELQEHLEVGSLTKLVTAFSREQEKKVYVQDKIGDLAEEIWAIISAGSVYVCGDAKYMAKDVHKALREVASKFGTGEKFITELQTAKPSRYQQDVW